MSNAVITDEEKAWAKRAPTLVRNANDTVWALGDWMAEGREWDAGCRKAATLTGYSVSHCINLRRVSEAFPPDAGRYPKTLSWGAHLLFLQESDAKVRRETMRLAADEGWEQKDVLAWLRSRARTSVPSAATAPTRTTASSGFTPFPCPHCGSIITEEDYRAGTN